MRTKEELLQIIPELVTRPHLLEECLTNKRLFKRICHWKDICYNLSWIPDTPLAVGTIWTITINRCKQIEKAWQSKLWREDIGNTITAEFIGVTKNIAKNAIATIYGGKSKGFKYNPHDFRKYEPEKTPSFCSPWQASKMEKEKD